MRKSKLLKRMCVFTTVICVTTQLLLYPIIPARAVDGIGNAQSIEQNILSDKQNSEQVNTNLEDITNSRLSFGYYDSGYSAPILEEPNYLGISQSIKLPASYSSRAEGYVTDIRNQGSLGTCWAFGPIAAMESYALRHGLVDNPSDIDLSEYALVSLAFDDSTFVSSIGTATSDKTTTEDIKNCMLNGGNDQYVFKTLSKWAGIMNETDYPYIWSGTTESTFDESKVSYVLTNQYFINMNNTWHVKNAIMENGAVTAHYNADDEYDADWYKNYHYTYKAVGTNHAIAIVGWDDSIAASNFTVMDENNQPQTPAGPGAWLIKNSWGTSYGDGGYMWVSYYDKSIKDTTCAVYQIAPRSQYDYNYQHDGATIFGSGYEYGSSAYANVFTVTGDSAGNKKQAIKAVSFGIDDANRDYSIQIYKNPTVDKPESGMAMLTEPMIGTALYAGYYTVNLPQLLELNVGDTFSVVITFDEDTYLVSGTDGEAYVGGGGYAIATNTMGDNQSYMKVSGKFYDMYNLSQTMGDAYKSNFCIKAMVVDVSDEVEASSITSIEKNGDTGFIIGWQAIKNDVTYELLRATSMDGQYAKIYSGTGTSYIDTNIEKYTKYYYKVRVYNGQTPLDSCVRSAYIGVPYVNIIDISSVRAGLNLQWNKVANVDGYKLYRSLDGIDYELMATVGDITSYMDGNVEYGKRYYYMVRAYVNVEDGSGAGTDGARVEESVDSIAMSVVRGINAPGEIKATASEEEYGKFILEWESAGDVDGYVLYRSYFYSAGQYVEWEEMATVEGNKCSCTVDVTDLTPGKNITFHVKAFMNVDGGKYLSEQSYVYAYIDYAPVQNIKWYVNSSGILNVKWDEYSVENMTVTGYSSIIYNDLAGTSIASSVSVTASTFARASLDATKTYYLYVKAKNAMGNTFTPGQKPLVQIGGSWGEFKIENIADVSTTVGETINLEAHLTYELKNFDYKYQWYKTTSKDGVGSGTAIVGATSAIYKVVVEDYGTAYYYCVCTGEYKGTKSTVSNVVTVSALKSMANVTVATIGSQTYTGGAITPSVTVKDGTKTLINGTDYTVSYSSNVNVGTATVTIIGKGNYSGSKRVTFAIVSKSISGVTVSSIGNQTYTGSAITPVVTVKDGSVTLVNGTDYTVSYSNNVNVGTATVTIIGKGNYSGSKSVTFAIVSKSISNATLSTIGNQTYTGSVITPVVTVKDGTKTLINGTDYTVSYSSNVNVGTATVTIIGKGNYSGSKSVTFAIVSKSISNATLSSIGNQTYTGSAITPVVTVKDGTKTLINGTDYTVSYSSNVNVGTATITIIGKGNYSGSKSVTFAIVSKSISGVTVSSIGNQTYTGSAITPSVTVKDGSVTLVNGTDYTVSYSSNVNVGTARVTINGKGNYTGIKTITFTIIAKEPENPKPENPIPEKTVPDKLTSSTTSINQTNMKVSKIKAGTTVSSLLSTIDQKEYATVYSGNSVVAGNKNVGTGMKLCIVDNGKITKNYTIIVTGDTSGDGKINITDMIAVKAHILKKSNLTGVYGNAGDVNGDGKINITDFIKIKATLLGKDAILGVIVKQ